MARRRYCPNCGEEVEFLDFANSWFCEGCHEEFETQDTWKRWFNTPQNLPSL